MLFDEQHKVIPETLTQRQAEEFDKWLLREIKRHRMCVDQSSYNILHVPQIEAIFQSAITRHTEDIEGIHKTRIKLRELFEL